MFIDIHTHVLKNKLKFPNSILDGEDSIGLHPYELVFDQSNEVLFERAKKKLELISDKTKIIGECGLDRKKTGLKNIEFQIEILKLHFEFAQRFKRPLIIHCVRSFSDVEYLLKENNFLLPMIFHDFYGNEKILNSLLKYCSFFSYGKNLLINKKTHGLLSATPIDRLFLETDDQSDYSIEEIYAKASSLLNIEIKTLEERIEKNYNSFFAI